MARCVRDLALVGLVLLAAGARSARAAEPEESAVRAQPSPALLHEDTTRTTSSSEGTAVVLPATSWAISSRMRLETRTSPLDPVTPLASVGVRRALLDQATDGIDVAMATNLRAASYEGEGALDTRLSVGRHIGVLSLLGTASIGRGTGARGDVDGDASALAAVSLATSAMIGVEARARTELVDEHETFEDQGRKTQVVAGSVASVMLGAWRVIGFGGVDSPRGTVKPGALVTLRAAVEL